MTLTEQERDQLSEFDVDAEVGFLPSPAPRLRLETHAPWEEIAAELPSLLHASRVRAAVSAMPHLSLDEILEDRDALERALLVLSFLGHAYLHDRDDDCASLPPQLAVPWAQAASSLDRPPVLSHASVVLRNWRRIDPAGPIALGNLATLLQFDGGQDESWFTLLTVEMEAIGAGTVVSLFQAVERSQRGLLSDAVVCLERATGSIEAMSACLGRMQEGCDPYIFYHRVRPYLSSLENITYEGVTPTKQSHPGGSAAQSSLLQSFDAALGIEHHHESSRRYLHAMRAHMPTGHRRFLHFLEQRTLSPVCKQHPPLQRARDACVAAIAALRQQHLALVARYIFAQAPRGQEERGTGGTHPMIFLKKMKESTLAAVEP